jgi:hypothetical protein
MIVRHVIECPGCKAIILLRVGVGLDLEQPFYFVCNRCNAITRGKQIISYENFEESKFEQRLEENYHGMKTLTKYLRFILNYQHWLPQKEWRMWEGRHF